MTSRPRPAAPAVTPDRFLVGYGQDWTVGVISEHLDAFVAAGGTWRRARSGSGRVWAIVAGKAYPVLCSEIVRVDTEDGPVSGRCGIAATVDASCPNHADQRAQWFAQSESEIAYLERVGSSNA